MNRETDNDTIDLAPTVALSEPTEAKARQMALRAALAQMRLGTRGLPGDAFAVLTSSQVEVTPLLLAVVQDAVTNPQPFVDDVEDYRLFVALALLAQFGEESALEPLLTLLNQTEEEQEALFGDVLTEHGSDWLAAIAGPRVEPIQALAENPTVGEPARSIAIGALIRAAEQAVWPRDAAIAWLRQMMERGESLQSEWVVGELVAAAMDLRAKALLPELQALFDAGLVDPIYAGDWPMVQAELLAVDLDVAPPVLRARLEPLDAAHELAWLWRPNNLAWKQSVPQPAKRPKDPKQKAKRKQAKTSRKKNRRK
jgi:hypothetical protein